MGFFAGWRIRLGATARNDSLNDQRPVLADSRSAFEKVLNVLALIKASNIFSLVTTMSTDLVKSNEPGAYGVGQDLLKRINPQVTSARLATKKELGKALGKSLCEVAEQKRSKKIKK